ncbi:peroxisomal coenzyme A diphosphatase NUDT7 isoform X2 [Petaurus breviceps papuanus]|uniref:peroxisomal coenzyme A diphosphatase NUDT7 isoform X2 n=1 Tax=Petaurus breviceps papuanus TaxID=3040969 RepID=UPI0036D83D2E
MERPCKNFTKDTAKVRLRKHDVGTKFSLWLSTKCSVLLPLLVKEEKIYLLFTVRSKKKGAMVTPVVGFIDSSFQAQPNPHEVSEVFLVPLEYFLSLHTHYSFYWTNFGHRCLVHCFSYTDPQNQSTYQIWGLTAWFALLTALIVLQKQPSFDIEYDLSDFTSSCEQNFVKMRRTIKSKL